MSPPGTELRRRSPLLYVADADDAFRERLAAELRAGGAVVLEFAGSARLGAYAATAEPDLILLATDSADAATGPVYGRLRSSRTGRRFPLVLVLDKSRPPHAVARSVLALCADWTRLCVRNLAGVVSWLQTRGKSGRFEVEAFGARGTIFLQDGELIEARWKELEGREVVRFFAEELPDSGFRFAEVAPAAEPEERSLEVSPVRAALEPGGGRDRGAAPFGEIHTAVVRLDLDTAGRLARAPGPAAAPPEASAAGNGAVRHVREAWGPANGGAPHPMNGAAGDPANGATPRPMNGAAGDPANGATPSGPRSPRLVSTSPAPRRPAALVRAISRAEREALLTGTDSRR